MGRGASRAGAARGTAKRFAQAKTTINVQYPLGFIFDKVFATLKTEFEKANPDITVKYLPAYKEYEDAAQTGAAPGDHQAAARCRRCRPSTSSACSSTARSPSISRRSSPRRRTGKVRASRQVDDGAQHLWRKAVWPGLRRLDADHLHQRRSDHARRAAIRQSSRRPGTASSISSKKIASTGRRQYRPVLFLGDHRQLDVAGAGLLPRRQDDERRREDDRLRQGAGQEVDRTARPHGDGSRHARPHAGGLAAPPSSPGKLGIWTESTSLLRVADDGVAGKFKWRTARFPVPGPDAKLPTGGAAAMMFATDPGAAGRGVEAS